jgi:hypothetical protein
MPRPPALMVGIKGKMPRNFAEADAMAREAEAQMVQARQTG